MPATSASRATSRQSHRRRSERARGGYGFGTVARMEWRKLRTVRSTWCIVGIFAAGMVGVAIVAASQQHSASISAAARGSFDPTRNGFSGLLLGQLLLGLLGVVTVTTEFSSGMIRATFAAVPRRSLVLGAKAAVLGGVALAVGELCAFAAFFAGQAAVRGPVPPATLGQAGVLRAVLMAGAYPALVALIGLGLGAIIRHTAGAICAVVAVLFVVPLLVTPLGTATKDAVVRFLPEQIATLSLTAVKPVVHALPPVPALGLLCGYGAAALAAGAWSLGRRDA